MKLPNTKRYYRDLAHYYFMRGNPGLMSFFRTLANGNKYEHSADDNRDWFKMSQIDRPEFDKATGSYVWANDEELML